MNSNLVQEENSHAFSSEIICSHMLQAMYKLKHNRLEWKLDKGSSALTFAW